MSSCPVPANLVEDLTGTDAFSTDQIAAAVIARHAPWSRAQAERLGQQVWAPATLAAARDAHRHPPELRTTGDPPSAPSRPARASPRSSSSAA